MVTISHGFDCADFFALLAVRRIAVPYPLQPATQISEEQVADRRRPTAEAADAGAAWVRRLEPVVQACATHRASVDLRYVAGERESGAVLLFGDGPQSWLVACAGATGRAVLVPADRAVAALLDQLPVRPAAPMRELTLPASTLAGLAAPAATEPERERLARAAGTNLATIREALTAVGDPVGAGQIGVLVGNDQPAGPVRSATSVVVTDGKGGRMLRLTGAGPTGADLVTLAPGSPAAVHRAVAELLTQTSQRAGDRLRQPPSPSGSLR